MNKLQGKRFRSVLQDIVGIPLITMAVIVVISVTSCVYSYMNAQKQVEEANVSFLKITMQQLDGLLERIEESVVEYAATDKSHRLLKNLPADTPREKYLIQESNLRSWLDNQANMYAEVQTAFAYYRNLNMFQFRGISSFGMQESVRKALLDGVYADDQRVWTLHTVNDGSYLLYIYHSGNYYGGAWLSWSDIRKKLALHEETYPGLVYLQDEKGENTCLEEEISRMIKQERIQNTGRLQASGEKYYVYTVPGRKGEIALGLLIPRKSLFLQVPLIIRILLPGAFLSVILVTAVVFWLRKRIAVPVHNIDEAMKIIAEGNLDYRLPTTDYKTYNEFDRLSVHFNAMMDELDEAQFQLYETNLREQKTRLTYISQQIRPHFILNALNIIYTYDESEFPLVKKMVMYLTAYFRYIVNLNRDFVPVSSELEHTRNYLRIQKERYPHRFDYLVECGIMAEKVLIPPLIIQTFLENSIKYGMKDEGRSFFFVNVTIQGSMTEIFIADTGKGFDEETLEKIRIFLENREYTQDLGVGIQNTIERLDILYNGREEIIFKNEETGGANVIIRLPVRMEI